MSGASPHSLVKKSQLRLELKAQRKNLTPEQVIEGSVATCRNLQSYLQRGSGVALRSIALYQPIQNEVDLTSLVPFFTKQGVRVLFPRLNVDQVLDFAPIGMSGLVPGPFGLKQPQQDSLAEIPQIVVVPGLGFSQLFHRIGYGKGHYDRALERLRNTNPAPPLVIAVGYDFQVVPPFETETSDYPLDVIVTPTAVFERE